MASTTHDRIGQLRLVRQRQPATGPIRSARMRRSPGDPATRLQLSRLLEGVDLQPSGLSPHAILIARRLQTAALADIRARPPVGWQRDLHGRLDELSRRAYRPARGPVPLLAESVLFADPSELLACLTRDVLAGDAGQRWYWRQALGLASFAPEVVISARWSEHAQWLPAAVAQLGLKDTLAAVSQLDQRQASMVVQALHRAWTLPGDVLVLLATAEPLADSVLHRPDVQLSAEAVLEVERDRAPWESLMTQLFAERLAWLAPQQQYLAGLVWTLARRPSYGRSRSFATAAARWLDLRATQQTPSEDPEALSLGQAEASMALPVHEEQSISAVMANEGAQRSVEREAAPKPAIAHSEKPGQSQYLDESPSTDARPAAKPAIAAGEAVNLASDAAASDLDASSDGVQTEAAGVLFLVNLLRWLDLPDSWPDDPWMSGWALLETLARGLLGAAHESHAGDGLWPLLRRLDGRAVDELPGAGLASPDSYTLPVSWLDLLGGRYAEAAGEAGVWSGDAALAALPDHVEAALSPAAVWWLRGTLPFVRWLLSRSLGLRAADELAAALLLRSGRVQATRTHVDLYLPLDAASLAVRLSGLDLDPGWTPALGRIVQFHFV